MGLHPDQRDAGARRRAREEVAGRYPAGDGWGWAYAWFAARSQALRSLACRWLWPSRLELWRGGLLFRALGVGAFGRIIPTGGILVRRLTGARMVPYTLAAPTRSAARDFFHRTCVFEALHLPFFVAMLGLAVLRLYQGRPDLMAENLLVNAAVNLLPILHHRHTRVRIVGLLGRRSSRSRSRGDAGPRSASRNPPADINGKASGAC